MTWISLVCLLALTSSAFGRSAYGAGYGGASMQQIPQMLSAVRDQPIQRPFVSTIPVATQGYGQQLQQQQQQPLTTDWSSSLVPQQQQPDTSIQQKLQSAYGSALTAPLLTQKTLPTQSYGQISQGYGAMPFIPQFDQQQQQQQQQQVPMLTEADTLCRGQKPETIIPLDNGRRFVVCLDESKGVEQQCPRGLYYHQISGRCERKLGPLDNQCVSQPCLNGGQCVQTDSSYQCQCAPGFDGKTCELDARVCQTQQPCGQSPDARCQSFRLGAALQYICILQDGLAYGLSVQQAQPSPCQGVDGPQALAVTNNGFIMCDGERMFVESCPGGTIWDDLNKACVWPDQMTPQLDQQKSLGYGQSSYGQQQRMIPQSSYGQQQRMIPQSTYGSQWPVPQIEKPQSTYGSQWPVPQIEKPQTTSGSQWPVPQIEKPQTTSDSQWPVPQLEQPKLAYGSQWPVPQIEKIQSTYGSQWPVPQPEQIKQIQSQVSQMNIPQQFQQPKFLQSLGSQLNIQKQQLEQPKFVQSYGAQMPVPQQFEQPKFVQSFSQQQPQQDDVVSVKQSSGY